MDAQFSQEVQVHLGQDDGGVHLAALQIAETLHGDLRRRVGGGADGEGQQRLVRVEPGIVVPQVVHLQMLDGLDDHGGDELHVVADAAQLLESVQQHSRCRAQQEIIRRFFAAQMSKKKGFSTEDEVDKLRILMKQAGLKPEDRPPVGPALQRAQETGGPAAAIELPDGRVVTGKSTPLLGAASAMLLNALKELGGIRHDMKLISPVIIEPIQHLKVDHLGNHNPRLHTDETLLALSICAATNPTAEIAMEQLSNLKGCEMHSTVILAEVDLNLLRKLGIHVTCEPVYQTKKLYHK